MMGNSNVQLNDFFDILCDDLKLLGTDFWQQVASVASHSRVYKYNKLQTENSPIEYFYILESGVAREHCLFSDGRDINSAFYHGPALIGCVNSYREDSNAKTSISMITSGTCFRVESERFLQLVLALPDGEKHLYRLLQKSYKRVQDRLRLLLYKNAEERLQEFVGGQESTLLQIPDYHIASYLGITPVTMHRAKTKIKKLNAWNSI
ncbi:hypothetical protein NBRC116493_17330 [Aurantivibrio infirmus]